jgi:hypothetical protein
MCIRYCNDNNDFNRLSTEDGRSISFVTYHVLSSRNDVFRVIVAGSRTFQDYVKLKRCLNYFLRNRNPIGLVVVSGAARGADTLGERYAQEKGYFIDCYPADWGRFGKQAGFMRNVDMAEHADALVAFMQHGGTPGTQHMIDIAKQAGLPYRVVTF